MSTRDELDALVASIETDLAEIGSKLRRSARRRLARDIVVVREPLLTGGELAALLGAGRPRAAA